METPTSSITARQEILAQWQAPILHKHERSQRWYAIAGGVVLLCAVYGILTGAWSFSLVALLSAAVYYIMRDHVPPLKTMILSDKGVFLEQNFTRWEELQGFWFLVTPEYTELHFVPLQKHSSDIMIQTGGQDINDLRVLIGTHIPELKDKQESFLDALLRTAKL